MRGLHLRAFLICFLLLSSNSVTAECLLSEDKAQNALSVFKSISTLDSFTGKYSSGLKLEGIAESYTILHNYIALKYVPKNKEEGLFIVAFDRSSWEYYLFHGSGVTEPNQFYKGSIDLKECSLKFKISNDEIAAIKFSQKGQVALDTATVNFIFYDSATAGHDR